MTKTVKPEWYNTTVEQMGTTTKISFVKRESGDGMKLSLQLGDERTEWECDMELVIENNHGYRCTLPFRSLKFVTDYKEVAAQCVMDCLTGSIYNRTNEVIVRKEKMMPIIRTNIELTHIEFHEVSA